jgi:hypothetical protein
LVVSRIAITTTTKRPAPREALSGVLTLCADVWFAAQVCPYSGPKRDTIVALDFLVRWWRVMPGHKFKIGQRLFLVRSIGSSVPGGAYVVIKRLPKRNSEFEYQIKSINEADERVVRESELRTNPWRNNPVGSNRA